MFKMGRRKIIGDTQPVVRVNPMRRTKKKKQQIETFKNSAASEMCKQWLMEQKKLKNENVVEDNVDENIQSQTVDNIEQVNCSISMLEPHRSRFTWFKHANYTSFHCEWKKCGQAIPNADSFCDHVIEHFHDISPNEDLYECLWDLCGFVSTDISAVTRHLSFHAYHTKLKSYGESYRISLNIPQCAYDSRNRNYIVDTDDDYLCQWSDCYVKFNSIIKYFEHVNKDHCFSLFKDKSVKCQWALCEKVCSNLTNMESHIRSHTKEKAVGCFHCGALFRINNGYYDHCVRQEVNNTNQYQCDQCFKSFSTERLLRRHTRMHINCIKCTLCDMSVAYPSDLIRHIRNKHLLEKPYTCQYCPFRCVYKKDLDTHVSIHIVKSYECQEFECTFTAPSKFKLKRHFMIVHGSGLNVYACHCCETKYKRSQLLSRHLKNKHNFQLPSGHCRFRYNQCPDGIYRLQTTRIESLEVTKQIIAKPNDDEFDAESTTTENDDINQEMKFHDEIDCSIEHIPDEDQNDPILKNIDDFKIMQYLQKHKSIGKSISIDIKDVDQSGRIVNTTAFKAAEIIIE